MAKSTPWKRALSISTTVLSVLFVMGATVVTIVFLQGYTIDFRKRELIKTGVLNIETHPRRADIFVNDQNVGQTNKVYPNLQTGTYTIRLQKEGFNTYQRIIPVLHGLASLIDIQLLYSQPQLVQTLAASSSASQFYHPEQGDRLLELVPPSDATGNVVTVNSYRFSKPLFDSPKVEKQTIATFTLPAKTQLHATKDLTLIPNTEGTLVIVGIADRAFLIDTNQQRQRLNWQTSTTLPIPAITNNYKDNGGFPFVKWQYNNEVLVVETNSQIWSYHTSSQIRTILFDKQAQRTSLASMSSTDLILVNKTINGSYQLSSIPLVGGSSNYAVPLSFMADDETPVTLFANSNGHVLILTTTKHSYLIGTIFSGQTGLLINNSDTQLTPTIAIKSLGNLRYMQFTDHRVSNVRFLDSKQSFSYTWSDGTKTTIERFVYNKEQPDLITQLGSAVLYQSETSLSVADWIANANYILFLEENTLRAVDFTGTNTYAILKDAKHAPIVLPDQSYIMYLEQPPAGTNQQIRLTRLYE